eukprot:GHVR01130700.1.p1 GENE.GHVR01130700.1~~GHVR01130700.1.p1  ORF type:complete len:101 (-),score=9.77 GHVR01130700.1:84-386(-)
MNFFWKSASTSGLPTPAPSGVTQKRSTNLMILSARVFFGCSTDCGISITGAARLIAACPLSVSDHHHLGLERPAPVPAPCQRQQIGQRWLGRERATGAKG